MLPWRTTTRRAWIIRFRGALASDYYHEVHAGHAGTNRPTRQYFDSGGNIGKTDWRIQATIRELNRHSRKQYPCIFPRALLAEKTVYFIMKSAAMSSGCLFYQSLALLVSLVLYCPGNCWGGEYSIKDAIAGADRAAKRIHALEVSWGTSAYHGEYRQGIAVAEVSRTNSTKTLIDSSTAHVWMLGREYIKLEETSSKGVETIRCTNPGYAFALERRQPLNSWVIRFFEQHGVNNRVITESCV